MAAGPALSRKVPPDAIGALRPKLRDRMFVKSIAWTLWQQLGCTHHVVHEETEIQQEASSHFLTLRRVAMCGFTPLIPILQERRRPVYYNFCYR